MYAVEQRIVQRTITLPGGVKRGCVTLMVPIQPKGLARTYRRCKLRYPFPKFYFNSKLTDTS